MIDRKQKVVFKKTGELIPYINNAKEHPDDQISQIAGSIKEFGFNVPILIDQDNQLIAGHGRLLAAKKLKLKEVPCIELKHLTDIQKKAFILADNKLNLNTGFNMELLSLELQSILDEKPDFDFDNIGFGKDELDDLLKDLDTGNMLDDSKEDEVPEIPEEPIVKLGDVIELGKHRLICGDSTDKDTVDKLMQGEKADLVFTDPPYRIQTKGGKRSDLSKSLQKQGQSIEFIADFDPKDFLYVLPSVFNKNMNAYIFCNKELVPDYLNWCKKNKYSFNILIWKKPNAIPICDSHRPDIEYMLLFRKNAIWNHGLKNVNYSRLIESSRETGLHPTMKPINIIENELLISSNKNSNVVDFFGGSGSTLIACEKTKRICYGVELDPKYCDVIIQRCFEYTGINDIKINGKKANWSKLNETRG